jgi:thiamine biosynthesis lipoprotein
MGTTFRIVFYAPTKAEAEAAARAAFQRIEQLNQIFSDYQETSELSRLCQKAGSGPVPVSPELAEILRKSIQWSRRSQGAFDVSISPLVSLWRRARRTRELPGPAAIQAAQALVDYRQIIVDPTENLVTLKRPKTKLDLGGIGKGYAADEVQKLLKQRGINSALVAAGGDICVSQRPPDAPADTPGWVVTIAPLEKINRDFPARLVLENQAVSTSGDIEQYVEINGVRYSHIVNPQTGLGLVGRMSATVVASRGTDSDAATKPVCVLGPDKGPAWIDQFPDLACLYLNYVDGKVKQHPSRRWSTLRFKEIK